jgi:hypothetical protein
MARPNLLRTLDLIRKAAFNPRMLSFSPQLSVGVSPSELFSFRVCVESYTGALFLICSILPHFPHFPHFNMKYEVSKFHASPN